MAVIHDPAQVTAFVTFSAVVAGTPGPSNALLTAVGAQAGVRRGLPSLLGQVAGMGALIENDEDAPTDRRQNEKHTDNNPVLALHRQPLSGQIIPPP